MFKDSYKEQHMLSNEAHVTLTESLWLTEPLTELRSCSWTTSEAWQKFASNTPYAFQLILKWIISDFRSNTCWPYVGISAQQRV